MPKLLIIANWKMNPLTSEEASQLFKMIKKDLKNIKSEEVVICPPLIYLSIFSKSQFIDNLKLGAQNCFWEEKGAFTGEISVKMLKNFGCEYVIVGHSERRKYLGETDEIINEKLKAVLKNNLKPILCIGETEKEYAGEKTDKVLISQLQAALKNIPKAKISNFKLQIAYEPIWAIGTGITPNADEIMSVRLLTKKILAKMYSRKIAEETKILYGGSVSAKNANDFVKKTGMNGLLIGGASLRAMEFAKIVKSVSRL